MYTKTLCALIGLVGAVENSGKTAETDAVVRQALSDMNHTDCSESIRAEKYRISPNCASCPSPCGNISDYPMEKYLSRPKEQRILIEQLLQQLQHISAAEGDSLPEIVYRAIAYIGYDLKDESYQRLLEETKQC